MVDSAFILAFLPFFAFIILLFSRKMSLLESSITTFLITAILVLGFWKILPVYFFSSLIKGSLVALDILIIIFGAIFFLEILEKLKIINNLCYFLESFSKDYRVQVILLAWFMENFIEGTAGFGTPSAVVAPILVGVGLSPITAVIVSLLGNSMSVAFGAAGTPIRIGYADINISSIPFHTASINMIGFLVPVFMLWVLTVSHKKGLNHFLGALPFAVWAGIAFAIPSYLTVFLGQEFPSIVGSLVGLFIVIISIRLKLFLPKNTIVMVEEREPKNLTLLKSAIPYVLLIFLLIAGKLIIGTNGINLALVKNVNHTINFYNPGFAFVTAALPVAFFLGRKKGLLFETGKIATKRAWEPFLVIVCMSSVVQLLINSKYNLSEIPSALSLIAKTFETQSLPFFAPFIGAFGSFLTGSATISNIMFGNSLNLASTTMNFDPGIILALALVGGAAGNMISLADILSAEAVVKLKNKEPEVLKGVILPCLVYLTLAGIVGVIFVRST